MAVRKHSLAGNLPAVIDVVCANFAGVTRRQRYPRPWENEGLQIDNGAVFPQKRVEDRGMHRVITPVVGVDEGAYGGNSSSLVSRVDAVRSPACVPIDDPEPHP